MIRMIGAALIILFIPLWLHILMRIILFNHINHSIILIRIKKTAPQKRSGDIY